MQDYLLFRLYGPLASWGDIAVGEYRPSQGHPSKSAVLGLVAGALGVRRAEEEVHAAMAHAHGFAVAMERSGISLRDYHTVQVPPERRGVAHATRKDELAADTLNTLISTRDYYCDALYTVCLWARTDDGPYSLAQMAQALRRPRFVPYLGRKSCPLALPVQPRIVPANDLHEAFTAAALQPDEAVLLQALPPADAVSFYWEQDARAGFEAAHTVVRRDVPLSRRRWQFTERLEHYARLANSGAES
jgi:CRISPR system Cascade subunit CasD